jgi:hypothetical protein
MLAIRRGELAAGAVPAFYGPGTDKTAKDETGAIIKSPANIIDVEPGGEAKLLEISGQGLDKFREFAKTMREWGLEIAGGMKADADSTKGTDSGRALEILYQNMILLLKRWRVALGNNGYIPLLRLIMQGIDNDAIVVEGVEHVNANTIMRLVWQNWMTPTGQDLNATVMAWQTLAGGSPRAPVPILPRDTLSRLAAGNLGITDTSSVIEELAKQLVSDAALAQKQAEQQAALEQPPQPKGPSSNNDGP